MVYRITAKNNDSYLTAPTSYQIFKKPREGGVLTALLETMTICISMLCNSNWISTDKQCTERRHPVNRCVFNFAQYS